MIRPLPLAEASTQDFILPALAVFAAVAALVLLVRWMRKKIRQDTSGAENFSLSDLRRLVKDGKMSAEEFERAKSNILEAHKRAMEVKPPEDTTTPKQFPPRA